MRLGRARRKPGDGNQALASCLDDLCFLLFKVSVIGSRTFQLRRAGFATPSSWSLNNDRWTDSVAKIA
jgi:hypothetical protein